MGWGNSRPLWRLAAAAMPVHTRHRDAETAAWGAPCESRIWEPPDEGPSSGVPLSP